MNLSSKQKKFGDAYAETGNGAEAARAAGYAEEHARQRAHHLLEDPEVQAYVDQRRTELETARFAMAGGFIEKLEPLFARRIEKGDDDGAMQVVELQGRLAGVLSGGRFVPRRLAERPQEEDDDKELRALLAKFE